MLYLHEQGHQFSLMHAARGGLHAVQSWAACGSGRPRCGCMYVTLHCMGACILERNP